MTVPAAPQSQSRNPGGGIRLFVLWAAILAAAGGVAAVTASFLPYQTALRLLSRVVPHADDRHIRAAFYAMLTRSLLAGGIALTASAVFGLATAGRIALELAKSGREAWLELGDGIREAFAFLRRQPVLHRIALAAIAAAGIAVRGWYLFVQPMRYDEACTYLRYVKAGLFRGFVLDYTPNNHLLNTLLIFISTHLAGPAPAVIRIPAFLAGCATIILTYYAAALWWGSPAALAATALVAANAELISFSTNARGYALITACFLAQIIIARAIGKKPDRQGLWALFIFLSVATILTVPTGVYCLAAASALCLLAAWRERLDLRSVFRPLLVSLVLIVAASALLYWPVILGSGYDALFSNRYVEPLTSAQFVSQLPGALTRTWDQWNSGWANWLAWFVTACAVASVALAIGRRSLGPAVFPVLVAVCLAITALQRVTPPGRIWLFLLPLYFATAATGLIEVARLKSSAAGSLAALVLLGLGLAQTASSGVVLLFPETGTNNDAAPAAAHMAGQIRPGDLIISTLPASYPVRYYLARHGVPESLWGVSGRTTIDRVIVFVDKPARLADSLAQAFEQSYTGVDPKSFRPGPILYESASIEVLELPRIAN
ncbi:MAG TPA: hypothetical protein VEF06_15985 [Bryobacteraceae bacterium]|nr:hypothetical protein [Bryobacteraceae bacterium]